MIDIAFRTFVGFAVLLTLTRMLGKKQLSQLTVFTYITGVALGNLASEMVLFREVRIRDGVFAMALWSFFVFAIEWTSLKSAKARVLMNGEPTIVIKRGLILEKALKKQRMNLDDLTMQLRLNQVFSVTDVEYAILEPNGTITVMRKPGNNPATKADMQIPPEPAGMPCEIIADGKIVEKNLAELGYSREQLGDELLRQGIADEKDVIYAQLQPDGSLHIQKRTP